MEVICLQQVIQNVEGIKIDTILFPRIEGNEVRVCELGEEEVIKRLNESNFTPEDIECKRREWLVHRNVSLEEIEENKRKLNEYLISNKKIKK